MATALTSLIGSNNTLENYKAWIQAISDNFTNFGIIKTPDTGQLDIAGITTLPAANGYSGYEIRRFTDTLSNSYPVYLRADYGAGTNATFPAIRISIGIGSNGTGTLTSPVNNTNISNLVITSNLQTTALSSCIFSGNSSSFRCFMFSNDTATGAGFYFAIARTKDQSNGNDTTEGVTLTRVSSQTGIIGSNLGNHVFLFNSPAYAQEQSGIITPTASGSNGAEGTKINFYPNTFYRGGTPFYGIGTIGYFYSDVLPGTILNLPILGSTRSYYFCGRGSTFTNSVSRSAIAGTCIAMLYE